MASGEPEDADMAMGLLLRAGDLNGSGCCSDKMPRPARVWRSIWTNASRATGTDGEAVRTKGGRWAGEGPAPVAGAREARVWRLERSGAAWRMRRRSDKVLEHSTNETGGARQDCVGLSRVALRLRKPGATRGTALRSPSRPPARRLHRRSAASRGFRPPASGAKGGSPGPRCSLRRGQRRAAPRSPRPPRWCKRRG